MGTIYRVVVYGLRGEKVTIDLCNTEEQFKSMTVLQLKEKIAPMIPENLSQEALHLIFTDKLLNEDSKLLSEYGIQHMSVIHMVVKVPGGGWGPERGDGGMGDKDGKNRSMERLSFF